MIRIFCDRCLREMDYDDRERSRLVEIKYTAGTPDMQKHLCASCISALRNWLSSLS